MSNIQNLRYIEKYILKHTDQEFESNFKKIIHMFNEIEFEKKKLNIISHESFSDPFQYLNNDTSRTLNRLLRIFNHLNINHNFEIKLLFIIRNQSDLLYSYYCHFYTRLKNLLSIDSFDEFIHYQNKKILKSFDYDILIKILEKNSFDKFKIFFYEDLVHEKTIFVKELLIFFENKDLKSQFFENLMKSRINENIYIENGIHTKFKMKVYLSELKYVLVKKLFSFDINEIIKLFKKNKIVIQKNLKHIKYINSHYQNNKIISNGRKVSKVLKEYYHIK